MNKQSINVKRVRIIETEVYSRVVGYYRPVKNWNKGKRAEFSERKLINANSFNTKTQTPSRNLVSDHAIESIA